MFALIVNYIQLPEIVATHSETHMLWVKKYIDSGVFICAGPKLNKLGGFILAKCNDKKKIMQIIAEDSFVIAEVAEYQIIEFDCKLVSSDFEKLMNL